MSQKKVRLSLLLQQEHVIQMSYIGIGLQLLHSKCIKQGLAYSAKKRELVVVINCNIFSGQEIVSM